MNAPESPSTSLFEKARAGLWSSLQAHLTTLYRAEKAFTASVDFTDSFPFSTSSVSQEQLDEYWKQRKALRELYTDETVQLDTLIKAIRTKGYTEDEKKQLYLLLLGYMDILSSVMQLLDTHVPVALPKDDELIEIAARFERLRKFTHLSVRGMPKLITA